MDNNGNVSTMPSVDELQEILRDAYRRSHLPLGQDKGRHWSDDLSFARQELIALGRRDVYEVELRRHELLQRGYTPPEDLKPYPGVDLPDD